MKEAGVETVEDVESLSAVGMESLPKFVSKATLTPLEEAALGKYMAKEAHDQGSTADDELATLKAKTMYGLIEDVDDAKTGLKKLLFLSSKQADLIARDPSAIEKMLAIFVDKRQPRMVINLLPSMIRCWTRVRPLPGDPDGESEGLAALDRFMAERIIPLAAETQAIIICSAIQPHCVLSESLSRMVRLARSRWGPELPFTILSCTGKIEHVYTTRREDTTWREIRNKSKVWKKRETGGLLDEKVKAKLEKNRKKPMGDDYDLDLDPNGTNFIIVDPSSSHETNHMTKEVDGDNSYNELITEIVRNIKDKLPSIAIQTGKSKFSILTESAASSLEVALSNMEAGTPVLMLDLTKRPVTPPWYYIDASSNTQMGPVDGATLRQMVREHELNGTSLVRGATLVDWTPLAKVPEFTTLGHETQRASSLWTRLYRGSAAANKLTAATTIHPLDADAGHAARCQQIEWYREQVEMQKRERVEKNLPDYDWDVCMIAHFHDGARRSLARRAYRTHCALATPHAPILC